MCINTGIYLLTKDVSYKLYLLSYKLFFLYYYIYITMFLLTTLLLFYRSI